MAGMPGRSPGPVEGPTEAPQVETTQVELLAGRSGVPPFPGTAANTAATSAIDAPGQTAPRSGRASIVIGRYHATVVVTVHGDLDVPRSEHLGAILADLIDGQGNLSLVVDLHDAEATDADSLWVFTEAAERALRRGGTMRLSEPPAILHRALQLRGLDEFVGTRAHDAPR